MKHRNSICLLIVFAFLISGCASFNVKNTEQDLKKRVEGLMQAKIDGKWGEVYTFYDADFRKSISQEKFDKKSRNMQFKKFRIDEIKILPSGDKAEVKIKSDAAFRGFDFKNVSELQIWILEDNKWFKKVSKKDAKPLKK